MTSLSESSQGEVEDNREKWGSDFSFRELTGRRGRQQREVGRPLGEVNMWATIQNYKVT